MNDVFTTLFESIGEAFKLIPTIVLSCFPIYQQLSSFKQDLIATALGISPVVFGALITTFKITRTVIGKNI